MPLQWGPRQRAQTLAGAAPLGLPIHAAGRSWHARVPSVLKRLSLLNWCQWAWLVERILGVTPSFKYVLEIGLCIDILHDN